MFDTHCHLNFSSFEGHVEEEINDAFKHGVTGIVIPGTDFSSSQRALEIALDHKQIYAACGIHPHHIMEMYVAKESIDVDSLLMVFNPLWEDKKVVAVGEIGIDRYIYRKTKYENYVIDEGFIELQKKFFIKQLLKSLEHKKSVIIHNREAKADVLKIISDNWASDFEQRMVLHCCEPDTELLNFVIDHKIFLGVDGDVTYSQEKQGFIKQVPLEHLVLETDSPFLVPEPMRSQKVRPNRPRNLRYILEEVARLKEKDIETVREITQQNSRVLFGLDTM